MIKNPLGFHLQLVCMLPETHRMKLEKHLELDKQTGVVDVHVMDALAQVESLLRDVHEIQRRILRVRGVPRPPVAAERRAAAAEVRKLARKMSDDAAGLGKVLKGLERAADTLKHATKS
jgi:hypothetical protein